MSETLKVDLSGQVAIVTGASRGLGKAMAVAFGSAGARVICVARNKEKLEETAKEIESAGGDAHVYPCDVADQEAVDKLVDEVVEKWEKVDILINNAGITRDTLLPTMATDQWDEVICTNLKSAFLLCRAASRYMLRARFGRIINISSVSGLIGNPGQTNYSASKAGLIGLTRSLSRELAKRKVTVNAIAPGFIESDMTAALGDSILGEVKKRIPIQRVGKPEEVAAAALFLASPDAAYITGHVLTVDGGMTG